MSKKPQPFSDEELKQIRKQLSDMEIPAWKEGHIVALSPFNTPEYSRFLATITADRKRIEELENNLAALAGIRRNDFATRLVMTEHIRRFASKALQGKNPSKEILHGSRERIESLKRLIATQTAAVKRLEDVLTEVMTWIDNWDPNFSDDPEWPATRKKVDEALAKEESKS